MGLNPKRQFVALNGSAGALTVIRLSCMAYYVEIVEDPAVNAGVAQGLQGNYMDPFDGSLSPAAGTTSWLPPTLPNTPQITLGNQHHYPGQGGEILGNGGSGGQLDTPGGSVRLGTPIVTLKSKTATATQVIVSEWY